ncbi:hypothetical protein EH240_27030 [Mesorhizobium tamadayense]|uniref:Uncharacterized protein n=1 Tax=Mesorhizobium tamadayense TaxID=425306 RepID=A0A3P3F7B6_9HYPH|nr:hypothetical protein EH240_27030 [Mesorhizobium tamadayense]
MVAALRMAGPIATRQHVTLAQFPFAGSDQHVSAQEPHQSVAQSKIGGSLTNHYSTLNHLSDVTLLHDVAFEASHAYWDFDCAQRMLNAACGAMAVKNCPSGSKASSSLISTAFR